MAMYMPRLLACAMAAFASLVALGRPRNTAPGEITFSEVSEITSNGVSYGVSQLGNHSQQYQIPTVQLATVKPIHVVTPIDNQTLEKISELCHVQSIPMQAIMQIYAIVNSTSISQSEINDIMALAKAQNLSEEELQKLLFLAMYGKIDSVKLEMLQSIANQNGINGHQLKEIISLSIPQIYESRFDILNPDMFTILWTIKMKAKEQEAKGENTDELWKKYWEVVNKAIQQGDL